MSRVNLRWILPGLAIAAMFALAMPTGALAQEHKDDHHPPPPHGGPPHPPPPHPGGPHPGGPPHPALKPAVIPHGPMGGHPPGPPPAAFVHPGPGGPPPGGPHFSGPQFSFHGHNFNRIHIHPFIYPNGWAYRQWAVGAVLPPLFLTPDYYYPEWAQLGLEPPPPGDQWVRYGPDLLLVDTTNGQVVDVAYGVFYDD